MNPLQATSEIEGSTEFNACFNDLSALIKLNSGQSHHPNPSLRGLPKQGKRRALKPRVLYMCPVSLSSFFKSVISILKSSSKFFNTYINLLHHLFK